MVFEAQQGEGTIEVGVSAAWESLSPDVSVVNYWPVTGFFCGADLE